MIGIPSILASKGHQLILQSPLIVKTQSSSASPKVSDNAGPYRDSVNETFSTIRAGSGNGVFGNTNQTMPMRLIASTTTNQFAQMLQFIFTFDTGALGAGAVIQSATISLYGESKSNGLGNPDGHIAAANPTNPASIATGDYIHRGSVSFGSISYANFAGGQYNDIALNASGLANINKTGITSFSWQLSWDINNSFTGSWASGATSSLAVRSADASGQEPKLTVVYLL